MNSLYPPPVTPGRKSKTLSPAAYSEIALPSLKLARSSRLARRIGKTVFLALVLATILAVFAPWQQSVKGTGNVFAYDPVERQQTIESPIKGRVIALGKNLVENAHVKKGDLIAEVSDIDSEYLSRLQAQQTASEKQVEAANSMLQASQRNLDATLKMVDSFQVQIEAYRGIKEQVALTADAEIAAARNKVEAQTQQLAEDRAAFDQVEADFERQKILHDEEIVSELKFQEAERKIKEAQAKVAKSQAYLDAAENELKGKINDREAKLQKAQVDIDYATAAWRKATTDVAKSESEIAKAEADVNKAQKDLLDSQAKVARQLNQKITAPFDGFLTRIIPNLSSQYIKEGDPICEIVPDTADRAVQIWLDGNDAPLVQPGRHVRLQFEGWPAIQFAGWPSVAVGTFGGEVISVDAADDGKGKFRILVLPDETDHQWPSERFLKQGVRTNGWVLLDQVPLWYEVWRNMNGFPPVVSTEEPKSQSKVPKLPK